MSGRGKYRGYRNRNQHSSSASKEATTSLSPDSPVLAMFKSAALKLNERQDRHERLVKLSRDVTIESKRIIFLLHSAVTEESTTKVLEEARDRFQKLTQGPIQAIGIELENSPAHLHSRAVTAGFQEYIEARTLFSLMENKTLITYPEIQKEFIFSITDGENKSEESRIVTTMVPHLDYMLGVADLTGELMRRAINSISNGGDKECFFACQIVRNLYTGYLGLFGIGKELARKMTTTRSNVSKVESAVYALSVRGGEALLRGRLLILSQHDTWDEPHSDDEGYY